MLFPLILTLSPHPSEPDEMIYDDVEFGEEGCGSSLDNGWSSSEFESYDEQSDEEGHGENGLPDAFMRGKPPQRKTTHVCKLSTLPSRCLQTCPSVEGEGWGGGEKSWDLDTGGGIYSNILKKGLYSIGSRRLRENRKVLCIILIHQEMYKVQMDTTEREAKEG